MKRILMAAPVVLFLYLQGLSLLAQSAPNTIKLSREGVFYEAIVEDGDTLFLSTLAPVSISSPRIFESEEEYDRYRKYKYYASKVYPYAKDAIRIFRETEYVTQHMKKRERRKHIKRLQNELEEEFTEPLKKLSKTQGKILLKMIEKELDTPIYYLIKDLRNGLTATWWSTVSKLWGYQLKDGYIPGEDPILDAVLEDLDVSYEVEPVKPDDEFFK